MLSVIVENIAGATPVKKRLIYCTADYQEVEHHVGVSELKRFPIVTLNVECNNVNVSSFSAQNVTLHFL